jgi:hypothetical protein
MMKHFLLSYDDDFVFWLEKKGGHDRGDCGVGF